jgi:putative FmdB family regulatory protein
MLAMPIYEYRCSACGKKSSALLPSYSSPDPACPHCGKADLKRLVSTFATARSSDDGGDDFGGEADDFGGGEGEDSGGDDFGGGDDDFGGGDDDF